MKKLDLTEEQMRERILQQKRNEYHRNKEKYKKTMKEYREKNKENISKMHKEYREKNKDELDKKRKERYLKNIEKEREQRKKWYWENKEKSLQYHKEYHIKNRDKINEKHKEYWEKNKDKFNEKHRKYTQERTQKFRLSVISHYSQNKNCCEGFNGEECKSNCGPNGTNPNKYDLLTLDHINGGGSQHRKSIPGGSYGFWKWFIKNNFPEGYRILCMNCNLLSARQNGFYKAGKKFKK